MTSGPMTWVAGVSMLVFVHVHAVYKEEVPRIGFKLPVRYEEER